MEMVERECLLAGKYSGMRILILTNGYLTEGLSGGEKHLIDIAERWANEHQVVFVLPVFAAARIQPPIRSISYKSWKPASVPGIVTAYLVRTLQVLAIVWRERADVVISSVGLFDLIPGLLHKALFHSRVAIYAYHLAGARPARSFRRAFQYSLYRLNQWLSVRLFKRADVIITCNEYVKQALVEAGLEEKKVRVVYLAVNVDRVRAAKPRPEYQAMFIGRLVAQKGVFDIIEAIKDLNLTVGMVGEGEEYENLQKIIRQNKLEKRVKLLGYLNDTEPLLYELLQGCDFFLFPSYEEGYGIVIAEAIAAGKPVIAYELPHYGKAFNHSILSVPKGDVAALRRKVEDLLAGRIDLDVLRERYRGVTLLSPAESAAANLQEIMRL
jgi:glycosyltransferase involved in cell wall biosynthesis